MKPKIVSWALHTSAPCCILSASFEGRAPHPLPPGGDPLKASFFARRDQVFAGRAAKAPLTALTAPTPRLSTGVTRRFSVARSCWLPIVQSARASLAPCRRPPRLKRNASSWAPPPEEAATPRRNPVCAPTPPPRRASAPRVCLRCARCSCARSAQPGRTRRRCGGCPNRGRCPQASRPRGG